MATTLEVVRNISQIMANVYDGALDEKGEPLKIGLRREEGDPILDSRVMDGFRVSFRGNVLRIHYHSEIQLRELHDVGFASSIERMISDLASFLKKEYKKANKSSLRLKPISECDILAQYMSTKRSWILCHQDFEIGGIQAEPNDRGSEEAVKSVMKKFLESVSK